MTTTESQPKPHIQAENGSPIDAEKQHDAADADGLLGKELAQRVDVGGDALDQVAGGSAAVIREAQALNVIEQEVAQPSRDALRGVCSQPPGKKGEGALDGSQRDEANSDEGQAGGEAARYEYALSQDAVSEVAQEQEGAGLGERRDSQ